MKAWLCLKPIDVKLNVPTTPIHLPPGMVALLAVYATKKAARTIHGNGVDLVEVEVQKGKRCA